MVAKVRVLFVCMANICRSPMAQGIFERDCRVAGLADRIEVDSAGTHPYHVGKPPDDRAIRVAESRDAEIANLRGRVVEAADFHRFDYIIAMDTTNLASLKYLCPADAQHKVYLLMDFAGKKKGRREIADPYPGKDKHFKKALDQIEEASRALLDNIVSRGLKPVSTP